MLDNKYVIHAKWLCKQWFNRVTLYPRRKLSSASFYIKYRQRHFFIINSMGQTATLWLSNQLNSHPEIACAHGASYPTRMMGYKNDLRHIPSNLFWSMSLEEYLSALAEDTSKPYVGSVHAFTYNRFKQLLERADARLASRISVLNMTRHPITRLTSAIHCWGYGKQYTHNDLAKNDSLWILQDFENRGKDIVAHIKSHFDVDLNTMDAKLFVVGLIQAQDINKNNRIAMDDGCKFIFFEKLIDGLDCFVETLGDVTNGQIRPTPEYIELVKNASEVNVHNGKNRTDPQAQFTQWQPWQREAFRFIAEKDDFISNYNDLGYDLRWVFDVADTASAPAGHSM